MYRTPLSSYLLATVALTLIMFRLSPTVFSIGNRGAFTLNLGVGFRRSFHSRIPSPSSWFRNRQFHTAFSHFRRLYWQRPGLAGRFQRIHWDSLAKPAIFTGAFLLVAPPILDFTINKSTWLKRNPQAIVYAIIGLNTGVFFAWQLPRFSLILRKYGLLVNDRFSSVWSIIGSGFSHQNFTHLFFNMFCLQSFGSSLAVVLGPAGFLTAYLGSIVASSFTSLAFRTIARQGVSGSLGASGGIFGLLGVFSYLFPNASVAFFFLPIPGGAWYAFLGSIVLNAAGFFTKIHFDYAAHIGGSLIGIYYGWKAKKDIAKRRRQRSIYF